MSPQIDLKSMLVIMPSQIAKWAYPLLMSSSSELHTVWSTYILIAAYGEDSDWQELDILPLHLFVWDRCQSRKWECWTDRAKLVTSDPALWTRRVSLTSSQKLHVNSYVLWPHSLHKEKWLLMSYWNWIKALFCYTNKAALFTRES